MKKAVLSGLLFSFFLFPEAHAAVFSPQSFTLANGLRLVIVENKLSPAVAEMVWIKAGSTDEVAGKTGLAHYLEHLMFRGTPSVPSGAFSATIASLGGNENAFTSYDYTAYHEVVAAKDLGQAMVLEADRMAHLDISPDTASTELKVVLSERDERTDNRPEGLFAEKMRAALYPDSAYGRPVIGIRSDIEKLTASEAQAFYRRAYAPDNAIVVISGNIKPAQAIALADATFGRLKPVPQEKRLAVYDPKRVGAERVEMKDGRVRQPVIEWAIRAPTLRQDRKRAMALDVLSELLAGGQVGVLYDEMVRKQELATGLDADYDETTRGPTSFVLTTSPRPGGNPYKLETSMKNAFQDLARKGFSALDVREAKKRLIRTAIFARDGLMAPCETIGATLASGYRLSDIENWPDDIAKVSVKDVNAAFRSLVGEKRQVTGLLLPDPDHPAEEPEAEASRNAKGAIR